jgi:citrate synthase
MSAAVGEAQRVRVPPGLEGVVLCETGVSHVDGAEGRYRYRDYDAIQLSERRSLEDVWHLLLFGELPDDRQRERFARRIAALRLIPEDLERALAAASVARSGGFQPMAALRTSFSLLAESAGMRPVVDLDEDGLLEEVLRGCAALPTLLAITYRGHCGLSPISPDPALGQAANFLWMLTGRRPRPEHARALERYLIIAAEHGMAASTLAARVAVSTGADYGSAIVAALGVLGGPLHGGAPDRALEMLDQIGSSQHAEAWLRDALERGDRIMGFGHRVYRAPDPRARALREIAGELRADRVTLAAHVEQCARQLLEEVKPGRGLRVNVEFYAAIVLDEVGIPHVLFPTVFGFARMAGWSAHILEQFRANRLIRPITDFAGGPLRSVPEIT